MLLIKRIHVVYQLKLDPSRRDAAERAHSLHADSCPVARSLCDAIDITTSLEMRDL